MDSPLLFVHHCSPLIEATDLMMEVVEMQMPWRQMIQLLLMVVVVLVELTLEADADEKRMRMVVVVHNNYCS